MYLGAPAARQDGGRLLTLLGGGAAGAPIDGRRELLGTMAKELTAARHQLQSLAVALPETQLYKATKGVSSALRVVEAAKAAPTVNAAAKAAPTVKVAAAGCISAGRADRCL